MVSKGVSVEPRYSQIAAMVAPGALFGQLYSFNTAVQGVRLLPMDLELSIGPNGAEEIPRPERPRASSYREALSVCANIWVSRFETLLASDRTQLVTDLTGGLDSRVVFAMLAAARRRLDAAPVSVFCSGEGSDATIARSLCDRFGAVFTPRLPKPPTRLSGQRCYETYKHLCLGAYHPVYFPTAKPDPTVIRVGGNGGENHRPFYATHGNSPNADAYFRTRAKAIRPEWLRAEFAADMAGALDRILKTDSGLDDPQILHYRHFRNRFHSGRVPQNSVGLHPLTSRYLDDVADVAGPERLNSAQILYDLMHSLEPELLHHPFDDPGKAPSREHVDALCQVVTGREPAPGRFLASTVSPASETGGKEPVALLLEDVRAAQRNDFVKHFFDAGETKALIAQLEGEPAARRLADPTRGKRAAAMILAHHLVPD
jgi:hypothetical protein